MLEQIIQTLQSFHWTEVTAVFCSIIYVILAARGNVWCWLFGIIGAVFWAFSAYALYDLYVDAILQLYYVFIGIYGWYQWLHGSKQKTKLAISILPPITHVVIIIGGFVLTFIVGYFFDTYTQAAATYLDAFTTVFSIITTVLVTRKVLENWIYWIIIDSVYIYLYYSREGYLFALLNVIFVVIAIVGFINWRKDFKTQKLNYEN